MNLIVHRNTVVLLVCANPIGDYGKDEVERLRQRDSTEKGREPHQ